MARGMFRCVMVAVGTVIFLGGQIANAYDWSEGELISPEGLANPYQVENIESVRRAGLLHALHYPVEVTGTLMPYDAVANFVEADSRNPLRRIFERIFQNFSNIRSMDDAQRWIGLNSYPAREGSGPYYIPFYNGARPKHRMGFTHVKISGRTPHAVNAFTISCAACHTSNLFGRPVMGLTNRFPRANDSFVKGVKVAQLVTPSVFDLGAGATDDEAHLYKFSRENLKSVEAKRPAALGLDTSLAHTALSLSRRELDPDASKSKRFEKSPRHDPIRNVISDSKPAPWWNVKYKNKWLLDGSVVAGNPIFTNILWNEIGRGTDLVELRQWLKENSRIIEELTTAVYSAEAPHITDYFNPEEIDIASAKRGEVLFKARCQKCHGEYVKGWNNPELPLVAQLRTEKVIYFEDTPIKDVGTDPLRRESMNSLLQLNNLRISKENGIKVKVQPGYVPPPLVGIWARFPYFHNNSVPTLCDVLTPGPRRPKSYWARPAHNHREDFDFNCNGYPRQQKPGLGREFLYSADRPGLSNLGHDERIFIIDGKEVFSAQDKQDLVRFLQTL